MFGLGPGEIAVIVVIALIFFGPRKLPELARSLAKSIQEFRKAGREIKEQIDLGAEETDSSTPR